MPLVLSLRKPRSSSGWESATISKTKLDILATPKHVTSQTNLSLNVIRRRVDLELSVEVPLGRLVADNIKVDGVVKDERSLPTKQDGPVLLACEIRNGWLGWGRDVSSLNERVGRVSIMSRCDGDHNDFVFRVGTYEREKMSLGFNMSTATGQLTQFFQRVIVRARFAAHPILRVIFGHG